MITSILHQIILAQAIDISGLPQPSTDTGRVVVIFNLVFSLIGSIALLVVTIAGFRYVLSHGDPSLIAQSKNAIIYSLVGLMVSISGLTIVNFVIGRVG